jgi:hypothetical protein
MQKNNESITEKEKLLDRIDKLRSILNDMCSDTSRALGTGNNIHLSRYLDHLICEYMKLTYTNQKEQNQQKDNEDHSKE